MYLLYHKDIEKKHLRCRVAIDDIFRISWFLLIRNSFCLAYSKFVNAGFLFGRMSERDSLLRRLQRFGVCNSK